VELELNQSLTATGTSARQNLTNVKPVLKKQQPVKNNTTRSADAVAKSAARQRAELSQRIAQAVAILCRLCKDVVTAARATAALYSGRLAAEESAGEAERSARRGKEFDARLARGLYQVGGNNKKNLHQYRWYRFSVVGCGADIG
jgi:hypothetical protein